MGDLWNAVPKDLNPMSLKVLFDEKRKSIYVQQWSSESDPSSECDTYEFKLEPH